MSLLPASHELATGALYPHPHNGSSKAVLLARITRPSTRIAAEPAVFACFKTAASTKPELSPLFGCSLIIHPDEIESGPFGSLLVANLENSASRPSISLRPREFSEQDHCGEGRASAAVPN